MAELKDCIPNINPTFERVLYTVLKYVRFFGSGCLTLFATFIVIYGIFAGESSFGVSFAFLPSWFGFILLLIMLGLLLLLEGVLVCTVDLSKHTNITFRDAYPRTAILHAQNSDEESVMSMIIGRQVLVIFTVFIAAQLTSMPNMHNFPFTNIPFPSAFQEIFLAPGLLGGIMVVVYAQLTSQMLATNYPVQFLNVPGMWLVVKLCKIFDWVGLVHLTWVVADLFCRALRLDDEVTVRLKAYDQAVHCGIIAHKKETLAALPELNGEEKARFNLPVEDSEYVPHHIIFCKLYELLKENPETAAAVHSVVYPKYASAHAF